MARKPHEEYCINADRLGAMEKEIEIISKAVIGNGKEGLTVTVPKLTENVADLEIATTSLKRNTDKLLMHLSKSEGEEAGKEIIRKRNRWIIGILVGLSSSLIAGLITIIKLFIDIVHQISI